MTDPIVPNSSSAGVILEPSKKKQCAPSKRWCFTWNNYQEGDTEMMIDKLRTISSKYIIGLECGEKGTPHLQGYIEFSRKLRPKPIFSDCIHWEKAKGNRQENLQYCSKENNYHTNFKMPKALKLININNMHFWQLWLLEHLYGDTDDRTVVWIWDEVGGIGKSQFAKFCCSKLNCICVGGKATDIFCGIARYNEAEGLYPEIVIIDCPRDKISYMNYGAIESVKNGLIFSGKYESAMCVFNSPHIVVFANSPPDESKYSKDRWIIKEIRDVHEPI